MDIHLATLLPHHPFWKPAVALGLLGIAAFAVRFLVQAILLHVLTPLLAGRHSGFISVLLNGKLLRREAQILPSLIVQLCVHFVPGQSFPTWYESGRGSVFPRRDESERG